MMDLNLDVQAEQTRPNVALKSICHTLVGAASTICFKQQDTRTECCRKNSRTLWEQRATEHVLGVRLEALPTLHPRSYL